MDRVLVSSLSAALQPTLDSLPTALDPRLTTLLETLMEAEGELAEGPPPAGLAESPKANTRVRFDFLVIDPPSPCDRESLAPSERLLAQLGEALRAAASLSAAFLGPGEESELLGKQVRSIIAAMDKATSFRQCGADQRRAAAFLRSELDALCFGGGSSRVEARWSALATSLIRFELKQLLNSALILRPETGNLSQNFEDAAALFHHALKLIAALSSAGLGESTSTLDEEIIAVAEPGGVCVLSPEDLSRVLQPLSTALGAAKVQGSLAPCGLACSCLMYACLHTNRADGRSVSRCACCGRT